MIAISFFKMYYVFITYIKEVKMLLTVKTISDLLKRDKNCNAIAAKVGVTGATVSRIAKNDSANIDTNTLQVLSDYFISEFDYMKKVIIELGE